jgi:hypothetical protein
MALGTIAVSPAYAQAEGEKFWITVEGYRPLIDSSVRIGNPLTGQEGTLIDLEEDLALSKRKTLPAVAAGFAIGDRWQVNGEYYALSRRDQIQLSREIEFDGATYPVNAVVESEFNSNVYRLTIGYIISSGPTHRFGAAIGAHITDFTASIKGAASGPVNTVQVASRRREALAPLPTVGLFGSYEPLPRVVLNARADYLSLKVGDYDGRLVNLEASAAYRLNRTLSLGLGYRKVSYRLGVIKPSWTGKVLYDFHGPSIFARAAF